MFTLSIPFIFLLSMTHHLFFPHSLILIDSFITMVAFSRCFGNYRSCLFRVYKHSLLFVCFHVSKASIRCLKGIALLLLLLARRLLEIIHYTTQRRKQTYKEVFHTGIPRKICKNYGMFFGCGYICL